MDRDAHYPSRLHNRNYRARHQKTPKSPLANDITDSVPLLLSPFVPSEPGIIGDIGGFIIGLLQTIVFAIFRAGLYFLPERSYWKQYGDKERWKLQFTTVRIIAFILAFTWMIILWIGVLYKCLWESVTDFISYFTNITFTYQAVYYLLYVLSFFGDPRKRTLEFFLLFGFLWNVFAQIWIVFVLVFGIFLDNAALLIDETKTGGGDYDDGVVLVADRLYHVVPLMVVILLVGLTWSDISDILILMFADVFCLPKHYNGQKLCVHDRCAFRVDKKNAWKYIIFNYIMAFIPLLLYANIVDLRKIYQLEDFKTYQAVFAVVIINVIAVIIPLVIMFYSTIPNREVPPELVADDDTTIVIVKPDGIPLPT